MGGTTFESTSMHKDVADAFRDCKEQAGYEHGHGGYSGTIVEKPDYTVITTTPMPYQAAEIMAGKLMDSDDPRISDKWGPAGAIPFFNTKDDANTKVSIVKVTIPGGADYAAKDAAIEEEIAKLKISGDVLGTRTVSDTPAPAKVKAEATKGKAVTRYTVTNSLRASWQTGLATQAEARAYAVEVASADRGPHGHRQDIETYEVVPVTRRENGDPLVKVTRTVPKRTLVVEVTVLKASTLNKAHPDGWLFFGWASC